MYIFSEIGILISEYPNFLGFSPPITDYNPKIQQNTSKIEPMRTGSPPMIGVVTAYGKYDCTLLEANGCRLL